MSTVRPPEMRKHRHYVDTDAWTVVDVDGVDRLFATNTGENEVRIDVDGVNEGSSDVGRPGDRVNLSIWLDRDQLAEALSSLAAEGDL